MVVLENRGGFTIPKGKQRREAEKERGIKEREPRARNAGSMRRET